MPPPLEGIVIVIGLEPIVPARRHTRGVKNGMGSVADSFKKAAAVELQRLSARTSSAMDPLHR